MRSLSLAISLVILFAPGVRAQREGAKQDGWSHLELGAANYGPNPPKTRERGLQGPLHVDQYRVLFNTAESIIGERGRKGIFYVNDLDAGGARFASEKLRAYLTSRGYSQVEVRELPGDLTTIKLPKVQSAHLKNPEKQLFFLDNVSASFQRIADHSETGLQIQTYHESQMLERLNPKDVRLSGRLGDGDVYYFPNGKVVVEKNGKLRGQPRIPGRYVVAPSVRGCGVAVGLSKLATRSGE